MREVCRTPLANVMQSKLPLRVKFEMRSVLVQPPHAHAHEVRVALPWLCTTNSKRVEEAQLAASSASL